ncbi:MAG TPA: alpha/beta hydrolase, partial [Vicinamibacteria bacterium]|nr:alpha/beta hydrolase [Vicinamibacteria bacterium]
MDDLRPAAILAAVFAVSAGAHADSSKRPIVLKTQGSFLVGGTVVTNPGTFDPILLTPDGQTIHGDHAYVQYQIPVDARDLPLVM